MLVASVISIATDCDHDSPQALLGLDQAMRIGRLLHWKNPIDDRSDLSVFNHLFERQQLLSRFPSCDLSNAITVIVEQKQRMVADRLEMPVVGATFLLPMHRALARIHVEHDYTGAFLGVVVGFSYWRLVFLRRWYSRPIGGLPAMAPQRCIRNIKDVMLRLEGWPPR